MKTKFHTVITTSIGISLAAVSNCLFIFPALSIEPDCVNYMVTSSGSIECYDGNLNVIPMPSPLKYTVSETSQSSSKRATPSANISSVCESLSDSLSKSQCDLAELYVGRESLYTAAYNSVSENINYNSVCQALVRSKMKAPATTKFVDEGSSNEIFPGVYFISGDVDSQNGYGALIRDKYYCIFSNTPGYKDLNVVEL